MLSKGQIAILKMAAVRPDLLTHGIVFGLIHVDTERNSYVRQNFSSGFGGVIMVNIKDSCWRPYLSTDRNHIQMCTTRPLEEQLRQVSKKFDQWSRPRCDNEKKFTDGCKDGLSIG